MAKMRWGNGEQSTGGSPYVVDRGQSSHIGAEYSDGGYGIKRKRSYVGEVLSFGELMREFETDESLLAFVKRVLLNRKLEIQSDDDLICADLVQLLREMLVSRRKHTEPIEQDKVKFYFRKP